jgi:hypothetical protein
MALKIPPPPPFASGNAEDFVRMLPAFNRWLLELTSILANDGGIDPDTIDGYPALVLQVGENTAAIAANDNDISSLQAGLNSANAAISGLDTRVTAAEGNITTLQARNQVFFGNGVAPGAGLGVVGDWYANVGGAAGARIYIKTAVATWTPFPF